MFADLFTPDVLEDMFVSFLTGAATKGLGGFAFNHATKWILGIFKKRFRVELTKISGNKIYKAYNNDQEISENVCEWVMFTIKETFQKDSKNTVRKLMKSIKEPDKFKGYLIDSAEDVLKNTYFDDFNKNAPDYIAYTEIIGILVEQIYKPDTLEKYLVFLNENQRDVLNFEMIGEILTLIPMIKNSEDMLKDILSILTDNYKLSAPEITDRNIEYIRDYYKPLFLENDEYFKPEYRANSENKARLNSVFVLPELNYDGNNCNLEETLYNWRFNKGKDDDLIDAKIFLLYGKAGDGKTSLVSHILAKNILGEKCHAIALRNHLDTLAADADRKEPNYWRLLKDCFKEEPNTPALKDKEFSGKVLILDGLDEVCVLRQHFNGNTFIRGLMSDAPSDVKILITSRNGNYFKDVGSCNDVTTGTLQWTEEKVKEWCDAYKAVHSCRAEWCDKLPDKLKSKEEKFRNALSTPIILYICCVRNIDISTENSIAGIYDEAFNKIGKRAFNEHPNFKEADLKQHEVNWQYTKELAFQMFLNGKLEEVVAVDGMNDFAKERTRTILKEKHETDAYDKIEPEFKKYFAVCPFVSKKGERGVEFAHKTVGEYFTAVKLYEDYFGKLFQNGEQTDDETVWTTIFQAFRYRSIPEDIIDYLVDITEKENNKAWKEKLFRSFHEGMTEQYWWKNLDVEPEYKANSFILTSQVYRAFANLTWYFTKLGFAEYDKKHYEYSWEFAEVIDSYFPRNIITDICCPDWKCLSGADLRGTKLLEADLSGADLSGAYLSGAYLIGAYLISADLSGAYLNGADLSGAYLNGADLTGADLTRADMRQCRVLGTIYNKKSSYRNCILKNAKLLKVKVLERDLPDYDVIFKSDSIRFDNPQVYTVDNDTGYVPITDRIYNPETNRMEYPKDKPKGD